MTRILLLSTTTGYQIRSFGEAAGVLGAQIVFASDRCDQLDDPWRDQAIPIRFHDQDASVQAIVSAFGSSRPDGILVVGDRPAVVAAHVAAAFGLPGHTPAAAHATRNKLESRLALQAAGLHAPWFRPASFADDARLLSMTLPYPVVVKPLAMSGSRGVIRANSACEFVVAFDRLRRLCTSTDVLVEREPANAGLLIESFIPGREFALEGVLTGGALRVLAIFDKPDPLDGPFFEETIYVTPSRETQEVQDDITREVAAAAAAMGLHHGPIHAECRVNDRGAHVLEIAARPIGGLCSRALRFVSQHGEASLEEVLLRHAIGEDVGGYSREQAASGVMMIPIPRAGVYKGVEGEEDARAVADIVDVRMTAKLDSTLVPLPEGKSYLGFLFARASEPRAAVQALRAAHGKLRFHIDRPIPVV